MTKTMSFAVVHFTVAFTVGYLMSGSVLVGGTIALVEPAVNTIAYHFHEQVWNRVQRVKENQDLRKSIEPFAGKSTVW